MAWIPYLQATEDTSGWSHGQLVTFVISTYLILAGYLATLALALTNFSQFIMLRKERCQCGHPLLVFYILVVSCMLTDIAYCLLAVKVQDDWPYYLLYMPAALKVLIGIDQIWMMVEMICHLTLGLKMARLHEQSSAVDL